MPSSHYKRIHQERTKKRGKGKKKLIRDVQLIAETYDMLKTVGGFSNEDLAKVHMLAAYPLSVFAIMEKCCSRAVSCGGRHFLVGTKVNLKAF